VLKSTTMVAAEQQRIQMLKLKSSAAYVSMAAALFLIVIKTAAGIITGSISVWASLLDSAMDIFASTVNFFAIRAASIPPDENHAYGHGKAESLAGLFQSLVITISGLYLIWEAARRLFSREAISDEWIGIGSMIISITVSLGVVRYIRPIARQTDSPALASDAAHYASDVFSNLGALLALLLTFITGWRLADPIVSILISSYILWSAAKVARDSIDVLMDHSLPYSTEEQIAQIVKRYEQSGVLGFHDLRTRRSGSQKFIDLHLDIIRHKTLEEAHEVTVKVIRDIQAEIPDSNVNVHMDPSE
jgi:ferrous-iron efflux pump FieF